jgi:hypothetical protein
MVPVMRAQFLQGQCQASCHEHHLDSCCVELLHPAAQSAADATSTTSEPALTHPWVRLDCTCRHLLVGYGRRHISLCTLLVDGDGVAPVHTILEVYR